MGRLSSGALAASSSWCARAPADWPPEDGYREWSQGWHASKRSQEWLYKPSSGIYYHTPSETLWKRSLCKPQKRSEHSRFEQVESGGGLGGLAVAQICGSSTGSAVRRAYFTAWRAEVRKFSKFEEMERDLTVGCIEGRMQSPPHASAPCREQSNSDVHAVVEEEGGGLSHLFGLFSWWPSPLQDVTSTVTNHIQSPGEPNLNRLSVSAIVRHNLQPKMQRGKATDPGPIRPHELWAQRESLAHVHREREGAWRSHMRARTAAPVIDDSLGVRVGDEVRFGVASQGIVRRAFVELDEYAVEVGGQLFSEESGRIHYFRADELHPVEDTFDLVSLLSGRVSD